MPAFTRVVVAIILSSTSAFAQTQETFVNGLVAFVTAVEGRAGDEGPALAAALDTMERGLAEWDRGIAGAESGLSSQIATADAASAARMRTALGLIYLQRGRAADALAQLETAAARQPDAADVHVFRGWALRASGRSADAAQAFVRAFEVDPAHVTHAYLVLHHARLASVPDEIVARATTVVHAAESVLDSQGAGLRVLVPVLLDDAAAPAPLLAPSAYAEGYELISQGRYAEAIAWLRARVHDDPLAARSVLQSPHGRAGAAAMRAGDAAAAVAAFAAAVDASPDSSEARRMLGLAYVMGGHHQAAIPHFEAAIRLEPLDERARTSLAHALVETGSPEAAEQALRDALRVLPRAGNVAWRLGQLYLTLGREADAVEPFERAAAARPLAGAAALHRVLGQIYENLFDSTRAVDAFVRAIDINPNDARAHRELAEALHAIDRADAARAEFVVALLVDRAEVAAWTGLGQMHAAAGRLDRALAAFRTAAALEPSNGEAQYALARTLIQLGREAEGREALAAYEALQQKAMEAQRRQYTERLERIEDAVESGAPAGGRP